MRIGQGFDAHKFGEGDHVILGGVKIDHDYGLQAHSDGDVLIHAVIDALLGAACLGDIGQHFPDTDAAFKDVDSRELLRKTASLLDSNGFGIINIDSTVVAQAPRLASFIETMRRYLAEDLGMAFTSVNVKATTTEKMGFTGRGEGIAAMAIVLLDVIDAE